MKTLFSARALFVLSALFFVWVSAARRLSEQGLRDTQSAIEAFSALAHDQATVTARLDSRGVLTLASVQAAKTVALAQYAAANDTDDVPHPLN